MREPPGGQGVPTERDGEERDGWQRVRSYRGSIDTGKGVEALTDLAK